MRCHHSSALILALSLTIWPLSAAESKKPAVEKIDMAECLGCHKEIEPLKALGKHAALSCTACHSGLSAHATNVESLPGTRLDHETCGGCHKDQFSSFSTFDYKKLARVEKSQPAERSPNPAWEKLMAGHGFTKEHNAPRGHTFMLVDHLAVDRAYGGRFQPKKGWQYVTEQGVLKAWDVLEDTVPGTNEHKPFKPETAPAANPTCIQCKSQDNILRWKFMGDKDPKARFDRTSNPVEVARSVSNALNCIFCHDPHAAKPRIVRDALIQALTRPEKDTLWHKDPKATKIDVVEFREGFRKIALLEKYDSKLQCGQCHVEYNCNAGFNPADGTKVGYDSGVTNHFPFKDVFQMYEHYNKLGFRDFKHAGTGGLLWKAQHPEAETFWNSRHDKNGVGCADCHMPKVKNKAGKTYTSHWQTSPRNYLEQTCLRCHKDMDEKKAIYQIDSIKHYVRGKMRKAEFWLGALIDKIAEAKKAGVAEDILKQAQEQHMKAHVLWEWWTAENSDGFHNPDAARQSLTTSVEEARKGIQLLADAISPKAPAK
ncbi:MAG: ammonia-forming cytochrome c nitrite reductase subunit c552 [Candidatus Wallbacteria bacterium]|nr:ammonia-forming cytochrome c nitrite reductase subunit c552 [Candidatus Wallbacteria bacterium]